MGYFLIGLVLSLLMLLGIILLVFFNKPGCKHCVYCSCCGFILLFFIYFIVALIFGILTPTSYMLCSTFDKLLGNQTAIKTLTESLG